MHLTDEQLAELIDGADAESTKKQIRYALGRLEAFARFSGTELSAVEALEIKPLDQFLSRFYIVLNFQIGFITVINFGWKKKHNWMTALTGKCKYNYLFYIFYWFYQMTRIYLDVV